jgi:hypothetical protein
MAKILPVRNATAKLGHSPRSPTRLICMVSVVSRKRLIEREIRAIRREN